MSEKKGGKWVDPEKAFVVHPDMGEALQNYEPGKDSIGEVFNARNQAVANGEVYWNTDHDDEMSQTARERSMDAGKIARGWHFPKVNRRKKRGS